MKYIGCKKIQKSLWAATKLSKKKKKKESCFKFLGNDPEKYAWKFKNKGAGNSIDRKRQIKQKVRCCHNQKREASEIHII